MKKLIMTEKQEKELLIQLREEDNKLKSVSKPYVINPEKVLIVKKYLDNNFKKGKAEKIGASGFPEIRPVFGMLSSTGEVLQNLEKEKLHDLLIEKFKKMFIDEDERSKFLMQVINDWCNNKINMFGQLSVNHL